MKQRLIVLAVAGALLCGGRVYAHHSFASTYVENQTMSVSGDLVQFAYRNPHALIQIMAPDANRQMQRWTIEWEARGALDREGVTRMTLKAGDQVIITGNPGKNPSDHWLRLLSIVRPRDGWKWTVNGASMH